MDGQFRKAASYSTNDDSATHDSANAPKSTPQATAPRVMTDRELLLSLHQKVDQNHKWVKRQFDSFLHNMTATHNEVKKTITTSMKSSVAPGQYCHICMVKKI